MFILIISVLIFASVAVIVWPLIKKFQPDEAQRVENHLAVNLDATRQQIRDIEKDVDNDLIAEDQLSAIRSEAENTLLLEMQSRPEPELADKSVRFHRITAIVLSLSIPVLALLVYLSVGTPGALVQSAEDSGQPSMQQLISRLEQRLADNPGDQQGWLVLAQTNMMMQRYDQAVVAMERLYQLAGDSPDVLARYADTLTMANNGRFTHKASELIEQTLSLDPSHVHGLWLAGVQAFQAEDFGLAVNFFQKARSNISDPENLAQIDALIKTAQQKGRAAPGSAETGQPQPQAASSVKVRVNLAPHLKEKTETGQTVFVFAKAANGPAMPLAVSRHKVAELPLEVTLDDSMAMMQTLKLSRFEQVVISARISSSGQPLAQPGDLQGESAIIDPQNQPEVNLTINQVLE